MFGTKSLPATKRASPKAVDRLLLAHYGPYRMPQRSHLLDELLYFMLSTRTTTPACDAAFAAFKKLFPRHDRIPEIPVVELAAPLRGVGLAQRRATDIKESWRLLRARFGRVTLAPLRRLPPAESEAILVSLPVNLIFLGRDFCNAREQNCPACPLRSVCPSRRI